MSNESIEAAINARQAALEKEKAGIDAQMKAAVAPYIQKKAEVDKAIELIKDIKRAAGLLPPKKPSGNPNFGKKKPTE